MFCTGWENSLSFLFVILSPCHDQAWASVLLDLLPPHFKSPVLHIIKVNNVKISNKVNLSLKKHLEHRGKLNVVYLPSAVIEINSCDPTQVMSNSRMMNLCTLQDKSILLNLLVRFLYMGIVCTICRCS